MTGFPVHKHGSCLVIELAGRLDAHDHARFLQTAVSLTEQASNWIIIDLREALSLEWAAYEGLAHILELTLARGGDVVLAGPNPEILRALERSGLGRAFRLAETVHEAAHTLMFKRWL